VPVSIHHPRYQSVREMLVFLRHSAGLSQVQLAIKLRVGQSYVSKIERGETYVDLLVFVDWCLACGTQPGQALDHLTAD
jgi:transcriptional regulator with XRE-family HTH domain